MLVAGSKICVLSSSEPCTGPRRGSLGFISTQSPFPMFFSIPSFFKGSPILLEHIDIFFFRFGHEKKIRCERQAIYSLFPIFLPPNKPSEKTIRGILRKTNRQHFFDPELAESLRPLSFSGGKAPKRGLRIGIIAPVFSPTNLESNNGESLAYVKSVIASKSVLDYINKNFTNLLLRTQVPEWLIRSALTFGQQHNSELIHKRLTGLDTAYNTIPQERSVEGFKVLITMMAAGEKRLLLRKYATGRARISGLSVYNLTKMYHNMLLSINGEECRCLIKSRLAKEGNIYCLRIVKNMDETHSILTKIASEQ